MKRSLADMEADKHQLERDQAERAAKLKKINQELEAEAEIQSYPEVCHLFEEVMDSVSNIIENLDPQIVSCSSLYTHIF